MRKTRKLDDLRDRARAIASRRARAIQATVCAGLDFEQIDDMVGRAVRPEDESILDAIAEQVEDYDARTRQRETGYPDLHGFLDWMLQLQDGISSLPAELPRAWLAAWRDGYIREFGWGKRPWSPNPFHRCEDCRLALPNVGPGGSLEDRFEACPACGGQRISDVCFWDMRKFSLDGGKTTFF